MALLEVIFEVSEAMCYFQFAAHNLSSELSVLAVTLPACLLPHISAIMRRDSHLSETSSPKWIFPSVNCFAQVFHCQIRKISKEIVLV